MRVYDCLCICCPGSIYYAALFISNCNVTIDLNCPSHFTEELFSCPMCALVCSSSFILQEHVELHLQEEPSAEGNMSFLHFCCCVQNTVFSHSATVVSTQLICSILSFLQWHKQVPQIPTQSAEFRGMEEFIPS